MFALTTNWESPAAIGAWLGCLTFMVVLYNQLAKARRNILPNGEPPNSQLGLSLQNLTVRVEKLETAAAKSSEELHKMHTELLKAGEDRAAKLHARMNPLIENTAAIKGYIEGLTRRTLNNISADSP